MGLAHRELPVIGVQFHPESILTDCGYALLSRFLEIAGIAVTGVPSIDAERVRPAPAAPLPTVPVTF